MTATLTPPTKAEPKPKGAKVSLRLPVWLRTPPKRQRERKPAPSPRDVRWWVGVLWLVVSALLLGLVAHGTIVGALQHARSQHLLYEQLRSNLANAITPLGQLDVDSKLVANGTPIALIEIPRLGISEVVVQGTRASDLANGPGHRADTVFPGQQGTSIILGRQTTYGGPFSSLATLAPGDSIEVTTGQGKQKFEVFGIRQEGDPLPAALPSGKGRLELVTASGIPLAPLGTLHIDASLKSQAQETPSPVFTSKVLDPSELAFGAEGGAWFTTFFWLQWLAIAAIALRWAGSKWSIWHSWIVGVPLLLVLGAATADSAIALLANLL